MSFDIVECRNKSRWIAGKAFFSFADQGCYETKIKREESRLCDDKNFGKLIAISCMICT